MKYFSFPVVVSATSAAGKDSLLRILVRDNQRMVIVPRLTTRNKRSSDSDNDTNYKFVNKERILSDYKKKKLLYLEENYGGKLYGVYKKDVKDLLEAGRIPIIIANIKNGIEQILKIYPDGLYIYISPVNENIIHGLNSKNNTIQKKSYNHLVKILKIIIKKRKRYDFDVYNRIDQAIEDNNKIFCFDSIIYNCFHKNGVSSIQFRNAYKELKRIIKEEILYRNFLLRFIIKTSKDKNDKQEKIRNKLIFLRRLRKDSIKEKELLLDIYMYENKNLKLFNSTKFINSNFATNLPIVKALSLFSCWNEVSRIKFVKKSDTLFRFLPAKQLLIIDEHLCLPDKKFNDIAKIIRLENTKHLSFVSEENAIKKLQLIAQGGFPEESFKFIRMASKMLFLINKIGFINTAIQAVKSDDWYDRRLISEALSCINPKHPKKKEILKLLFLLCKDTKIDQVNIPALRGLKNFVEYGYKVTQIKSIVKKMMKDPHRAWIRREMIEILSAIGDGECFKIVCEELSNTERYDNRLAVLENITKFKNKKSDIYQILIYISRFDQVINVQSKAKELLTKYFNNYIQNKKNKSNITDLLSKSWLTRIKVVNTILGQKNLNENILIQALKHKDWKIRYTAIHLIKFSQLQLNNDLVTKILKNHYPSLRINFIDNLNYLQRDLLNQIIILLNNHSVWIRITAVLIIKNILDKFPKNKNKIDEIILNLYTEEKNLLVKTVAGYVLGYIACTESKIKNIINNELISNHNLITKWSIIEGADIAETEVMKNIPLNNSKIIKSEFNKVINNFNRRLLSKYLGHIVTVIFDDNSYTKQPPIICRGSDLDIFRIVYTGYIPDKYKEELRNNIWNLGLYIKPNEPEWWLQLKSQNMFRGVADVIVYKYPKSCLIRPSTNDFIDQKIKLRKKLFSLIKNKKLNSKELNLIRKLHRQFTLQRLFAIKTHIHLINRNDKQALDHLLEWGFIKKSCYSNNLFTTAWMTFTGNYIYINY